MKNLIFTLIIVSLFTSSSLFALNMSSLRDAQRTNTLKTFKQQFKYSNKKLDRHRASRSSHNNRFVHQERAKLMQTYTQQVKATKAIEVYHEYKREFEHMDIKNRDDKFKQYFKQMKDKGKSPQEIRIEFAKKLKNTQMKNDDDNIKHNKDNNSNNQPKDEDNMENYNKNMEDNFEPKSMSRSSIWRRK